MSSNKGDYLYQRDAVNVTDALERDKLVRRIKAMRAEAVLEKNTIEHWNAAHPGQEPLNADFWDEVIAWCDGRGPLPADPASPPRRAGA